MRYLTITVENQESDTTQQMTVEQILKKQCGFTKKQIRQAKFRSEGIFKNGFRCRVTESVCPGDIIRICLEEEREVSRQLEGDLAQLTVLYEDDDLLAVYKPAGLVTHPQGGHYQDTLANQVAAYFREKGEEHGIRPVGRLDKETSGIVVFAKSQMAAGRLQEQREQGRFSKTYLAVVQGEMELDDKEHQICLPIGPDPADRLKMRIAEDGKYASTHYRVRKHVEGKSIVELTLDTGRTHQIRVHMAALGHPLVGDQLYGGEKSGDSRKNYLERAALHAWKVELDQPFTGETIKLTAPVPEDIQKII